MSVRRNKAFTLTEMLVVISIIGVLVSMLLPAVQHAREAARRATCLNNLRQCAHGIITYDARKGFLPASRSFYNVNGGVIQNWVVPVLPMIERQDLADTIRANGNDPTPAKAESISVLLCPDDPDQQKVVDASGNSMGGLSYRVNGGRANVLATNFDYLANGLFVDNGTAVPPAPPDNKMSLDRVRDGASSTLMVAENIIILSRTQPSSGSSWAFAPTEQDSQVLWFVPEVNPSDFIGLNQDDASGSVPADLRRFARPSSYHPGGFCFAFGDESTRFMSESVDYRIYAVLMTSYGDKARDPSGSTTAPDPKWQSSGWVPPTASSTPYYPGTKF